MLKTFLATILLLFPATKSLHNFTAEGVDGNQIDFKKFKGKKVLIVNTASECGYTTQYKGLQELYETNNNKLVVVAFPANNFGGQEPGSNSDIKQFCSKNYNVTFPVAAKVSVLGNDINPIFKWLIQESNPDFTGDIKWNFEKFLLDENGKLIRRFRSKVNPMSDDIVAAINS
ncbi:MAG: glutathione peroxidase [Bacteroidetes bacterium]|nr:glutathione peroxidase [Bacteroidota bacterium]